MNAFYCKRTNAFNHLDEQLIAIRHDGELVPLGPVEAALFLAANGERTFDELERHPGPGTVEGPTVRQRLGELVEQKLLRLSPAPAPLDPWEGTERPGVPSRVAEMLPDRHDSLRKVLLDAFFYVPCLQRFRFLVDCHGFAVARLDRRQGDARVYLRRGPLEIGLGWTRGSLLTGWAGRLLDSIPVCDPASRIDLAQALRPFGLRRSPELAPAHHALVEAVRGMRDVPDRIHDAIRDEFARDMEAVAELLEKHVKTVLASLAPRPPFADA